jgi:hypothetical protein
VSKIRERDDDSRLLLRLAYGVGTARLPFLQGSGTMNPHYFPDRQLAMNEIAAWCIHVEREASAAHMPM